MIALIVFYGILGLLVPQESPRSNVEVVVDWMFWAYYAFLLVFLWTPAMHAHFSRSKTA